METKEYKGCVMGFSAFGVTHIMMPKEKLAVNRGDSMYTDRLVDMGLLGAPDGNKKPFIVPDAVRLYNNVGTPGKQGFGVGIAKNLPIGMAEMEGTRTPGHPNYGNYRYVDGSIMVYIPRFYYRWGHATSPRAAEYGFSACDVASMHDFRDVAAANEAGYALHRAFIDGGEIKDGFFVDKYLCSNNNGVASSIKNAIPLSTHTDNNPINALENTPANNYAGTIDAVKTRGDDFFVTTIYIQRALSLLAMAHAQAAISDEYCAWYDPDGATNYPKGCNNNALGDVDDASIKYVASGYSNAAKTGSANEFAKTTHNGQANGIADLNGLMWEVAIGLTQLEGKFYLLNTDVEVAQLTSGTSRQTDVWGDSGIANNYVVLGTQYGAITGDARTVRIGTKTKRVFTAATAGKDWLATSAGIPLSAGVSTSGDAAFGKDALYDNRIESLCPLVGGSWTYGSAAGLWCLDLHLSRTSGYSSVGVRAALYSV